MRTWFFIAAVLGLVWSAAAQEPSGQVFKSGVTMIQVPVVVRDHEGHEVGDLSKEDFQLFDNGKRVEIASFTVEKPGSQTVPDRSLPDAGAGAPKPGNAMDVPERFIAYFFDDVSIGLTDLARVREAAGRQIGALQPGDRAAVFTASCHTMVDFTNDQAKLRDAIGQLQVGAPRLCRVSRVDVMQVEVLKNIVRRMSTLPGKRKIVLVSPGFWVGHDRWFEANALIEGALQAKVVIDALDTGGATDFAGTGAAPIDPRFGGGPGMGGGRLAGNPAQPLVLTDLAHGTGGTYVTGNDYGANFRRLATPQVHYVLAFVPTGKADGRAHQLKVKLENGHKLTVEARSEYVADAGN